MITNKYINDAVELWKEFEKTADFKEDVYDAILLEKIKEKLNLPLTDSMISSIEQYSIGVEELLFAIIHTLEPFSLMMTDLLEMFENAGAKKSDNNILINFNFESSENKFEFDLNSFRESVSMINKVSKFIEFKIESPWKIIEILKTEKYKYLNYFDLITSYKTIENWISVYEIEDIFPDYIPKAPKTNIERIDKKIRLLWRVYELLFNEYKTSYDQNKSVREAHSDKRISNKDDGNEIWCAETDFWTCSLIKLLALRVDNINDSKDSIEQFENDLDRCISLIEIDQKEIERQVESVIEILNLPFWKKRYEMYSVWTSTQIIKALNDFDIEFNIVDNTLSFSFAGSKIATCKKLNPPLEIWSELRSYYKTPISKKRKSHIQPDYTLAVNDVNKPENTVVVIECKQYKKYNSKNFAEAVIDYANGRPNASVMLNNYTMIPKRIYGRIKETIRNRISFFGDMYPNTSMTKEFRETLKKSVINYYQINWLNENLFLFNVNDLKLPCEIKLKWGDTPKDLDLYMVIGKTNSKMSLINYLNFGSNDREPYAVLNKDCRGGYGEEIITIYKFINSNYDIYVNNYSGENTVNGLIEVSINAGNIHKQIYRNNPIEKSSKWHVFRISESGIEIIDELEKYSF